MFATSDSNLVKAAMNIFDSFLDDYLDEKYMAVITDLDMRAQHEASLRTTDAFSFRWKNI